MPEDKTTSDPDLVALSKLVRVEAHRRKSKTGKTENVEAYLRKVLDLMGGNLDAKTKKGAFAGDRQSTADADFAKRVEAGLKQRKLSEKSGLQRPTPREIAVAQEARTASNESNKTKFGPNAGKTSPKDADLVAKRKARAEEQARKVLGPDKTDTQDKEDERFLDPEVRAKLNKGDAEIAKDFNDPKKKIGDVLPGDLGKAAKAFDDPKKKIGDDKSPALKTPAGAVTKAGKTAAANAMDRKGQQVRKSDFAKDFIARNKEGSTKTKDLVEGKGEFDKPYLPGAASSKKTGDTDAPEGDAPTTGGSAPDTAPAQAAMKAIKIEGTGNGSGTQEDPILVGGDLDRAVQLLAEGKHVRLDQPAEVSVVVEKLLAYANEVKAKGDKAPNINLCAITVPGTNLFCTENKGIPRAQMPQFSGKPEAGSPAMARFDPVKGEANITQDFRDALAAMGVSITSKTMPATHLKATQSELDGPKVAGMAGAMKAGKIPDAGIFVTRDGYVIDGHHRWAAKVVLDSEDNDLGDIQMPVDVVDMDIGAAIDFANQFAETMGIRPKGLGSAAEGVGGGKSGDGLGTVNNKKTPGATNATGTPVKAGTTAMFGQQAAAAPAGTIRTWDGKKYKKGRSGDWTYVGKAGSDNVAASNTNDPWGCCKPSEEDAPLAAVVRLAMKMSATHRYE